MIDAVVVIYNSEDKPIKELYTKIDIKYDSIAEEILINRARNAFYISPTEKIKCYRIGTYKMEE